MVLKSQLYIDMNKFCENAFHSNCLCCKQTDARLDSHIVCVQNGKKDSDFKETASSLKKVKRKQ